MYRNIKAAFISKTVSPEILKHLLIPKAHSLYHSSAMIIALDISKERSKNNNNSFISSV